MRIGFDAHVLDGRDQGSRTVLLRMANELASRHPSHDFFIYAENKHPELDFSYANLHFRYVQHRGAWAHLMSAMPKAYKDDNIDTMVFTYITSPFIPRTAVFFHDVLPISHPKYFSLRFVVRCLLLYGGSSLLARHIFTISHYSRTQIERFFPWSRRNDVHVMPISASFHESTYRVAPNPVALHRALVGGGRYALVVGRIEARKNTQLAVDAFHRGAPADCKLVVVGRREPGIGLDVHDDPRIVELSGVSDSDLAEIYRNAALFLYPSSAEGFGLPLLDAILFGLPVISSDRTSMAEVGGDAVEFFDPEAPGAVTWLADRISAHFGDRPVAPPTLVQRQQKADQYSWANTADTFVAGVTAR